MYTYHDGVSVLFPNPHRLHYDFSLLKFLYYYIAFIFEFLYDMGTMGAIET
jgi:hypothetical protein